MAEDKVVEEEPKKMTIYEMDEYYPGNLQSLALEHEPMA